MEEELLLVNEEILSVWKVMNKKIEDLLREQILAFYPEFNFSSENLKKEKFSVDIKRSDFMGVTIIRYQAVKDGKPFGKIIKFKYDLKSNNFVPMTIQLI